MVMEVAKEGGVTDVKLQQVLRMNGGEGENSYANNCLLQKKVLVKAKPILQESMMEICSKSFPKCIRFADLGCFSGPNTFIPIREIIDTIDMTCKRLNKNPPILQVLLNDLPGNDFNSIFQSLPSFQKKLQEERGGNVEPCFVAAVAGSFFGRLFPPHSVHLVHSSCSLHWFSEVPKCLLNHRQIYVTKTSPPEVHEAYLGQFERDFMTFLRSRSEEVIPGGRIVFTVYGREEDSFTSDTSNPSILELFGTMLSDMVSQGMIEESKLYAFNIPFYGASAEEMKKVIKKFKIKKIESFKLEWDEILEEGLAQNESKEKLMAKTLRAILESLLLRYFGEDTIDIMFQRFTNFMADNLDTVDAIYTNVVSLTKDL